MAAWSKEITTREEIREQKRRAVLKVAARLFNEKGYHAVSLDEITAEIGVTKAALYYYFKNKEELLYESLLITYGCGQRARDEAEKFEGTAHEKLQQLYRQFIKLLVTEQGAYTSIPNIRALPEDLREDLQARRQSFDRYSRRLIQQAIDEGDLRDIDARITSNFFLGAINWILRWYGEDDNLGPDEISERYVDLFMNGAAAHKV